MGLAGYLTLSQQLHWGDAGKRGINTEPPLSRQEHSQVPHVDPLVAMIRFSSSLVSFVLVPSSMCGKRKPPIGIASEIGDLRVLVSDEHFPPIRMTSNIHI